MGKDFVPTVTIELQNYRELCIYSRKFKKLDQVFELVNSIHSNMTNLEFEEFMRKRHNLMQQIDWIKED